MVTGPKTSTKFETRSGFEEEIAKALGHKNLTEYYETLLTSGKQKASDAASTIYGQRKQQAAEAASYDISKAYANYLKQQRNVMGTAQLERGHQEELSSALKSSFESSVQQARAVEAQALAKVSSEASKIYTDVFKSESGKAEQLLQQYQQQAQIKANLYKFIEEKSGYSEDGLAYYDENMQLTPWGEESIRKYTLEEGSKLKADLEAAGMENELAYYLSNPTGVRKELFGIEDEIYSSTSKTAQKANVSILNTDFYTQSAHQAVEKAGEGGYQGYVSYYEDTFGLTKDEIRTIMRNSGITGLSASDVQNLSDDDLLRLAQGQDWERWHYELTKKAEEKHGYDYFKQLKSEQPVAGASFGGR